MNTSEYFISYRSVATVCVTVTPTADGELLNALIEYRARLVHEKKSATKRIREHLSDEISGLRHSMKGQEPFMLEIPTSSFIGIIYRRALGWYCERLQTGQIVPKVKQILLLLDEHFCH